MAKKSPFFKKEGFKRLLYRLKLVCDNTGLKHRELAVLLYTTPQSLCNWFSHKTMPNKAQVVCIYAWLELSEQKKAWIEIKKHVAYDDEVNLLDDVYDEDEDEDESASLKVTKPMCITVNKKQKVHNENKN